MNHPPTQPPSSLFFKLLFINKTKSKEPCTLSVLYQQGRWPKESKGTIPLPLHTLLGSLLLLVERAIRSIFLSRIHI
jgi:hypothetical protein